MRWGDIIFFSPVPFLSRFLCKTVLLSQCHLLLGLGFFLLQLLIFFFNNLGVFFGGWWWGREAPQIAQTLQRISYRVTSKSSAVRWGKGFCMKHQSTSTVAQIHLSHACWVPQYLQSENEEMNKTCLQSLTHTHASTQTLWHFSSSEIMQEKKKIQTNNISEIILCFADSVMVKKIYIQEKYLCLQLELSFLRKVPKHWLNLLCLRLPKTWLAHWHAKHRHFPKRVTTHLPREKEQCQNDIIPFLVCYKLNNSGQLRGP